MLHIIIPTWDNAQYLDPCVLSILKTGILNERARLFIVNNGKQPVKAQWGGFKGVEVLEPGENLGWERGLDYALKRSDAPLVVFQNDDTFLPMSSCRFYQRLMVHFADTSVAAVGPSTTVASGLQTIYAANAPMAITDMNWLIFFTVMVRRTDLDVVGGVDTELPGGDDLDLSIRLKKAGKRVLFDPGAFIIHHGFKTGTRVHGDGYAGAPEGWNSRNMIERTQHALIRKHGFKAFWNYYYHQKSEIQPAPLLEDIEGKIIRAFSLDGQVLELGCGGQKTIPGAVGVDRVPKGEEIPHVPGVVSVADVVADVQESLPFPDLSQDAIVARHILEHCLDTVKTLKQWNRVLKLNGKLVIAVPDEAVTVGIPLNAEHCHAFTGESLKSLAAVCGFREVGWYPTGNHVSFVSIFEKCRHVDGYLENTCTKTAAEANHVVVTAAP